MIRFFIFLLLISSSWVYAHPDDLEIQVSRVYDGDTFKIVLTGMVSPLNKLSIRIKGIDTPEKGGRAKCEKERIAGQIATEYLQQLISNKIVTLKNYHWGKYGGRIISDVFVNDVNIAEEMLLRGYARPYNGRGKRSNWC